jgi:hypothetical protein
MLTSGKLVDHGEVRAGGRTVRRLTRDEAGLRKLVFDVDPVTIAPVGGTMTFFTPRQKTKPAFTLSFTVEAFERLPITPCTERLLTIAAPNGTRTVVVTAAEMRRRLREYKAWRKRCVKRKHGGLKCPTRSAPFRR